MTNQFIVVIGGALIVWILKSLFTHFLTQSRLKKALLTDIQLNIDGAKEQTDTVRILFEGTIEEGVQLPFPFSYNVGSFGLFESVHKELPIYLFKADLVKVIKVYQALWALDVSINSFAQTLSIWERDKVKLTAANIQHLEKRKVRIESLYEAISTNKITSLSDLPNDYSHVKSVDTVVRNK